MTLRTITIRFLYPVQIAYQIARQAGTSIYLVGGTLRDGILDSPTSSDCDFAVGGRLEDFVRAFAEKVHGKVIPWDTEQIRVAFRYGNDKSSADFSGIKRGDISYDLTQRDFTVNAMAVDIIDLFEREYPAIIDPCNGRNDVQRRIIKCCSSTSFDNDPLRMLRAIRLARECAFTIDSATLQAINKKAHLIKRISRERIKRELFMILGLRNAYQSLLQLCQTGIISHLLPELDRFHTIQQSAPHEYNLFYHLLKTVEKIDNIASEDFAVLASHKTAVHEYLKESIEEGVTRRSLLVFAALLHDSGKYDTAKDENGRVTFYGHEKQGEHYNRIIAQRLGLGRNAQNIVGLITRQHMRLLQLSLQKTVTERAQIRIIKDINEVFWEAIIIALADVMATSSDPESLSLAEELRMLAMSLAVKRDPPVFAVHKKSLLNGSEVIKLLNIKEGPLVGKILAELHDQERKGLVNNRDDAIQWVRARKKQL